MPISHAHLRSFHAVATHGSFTNAAEILHITQPTLSGQVKELEEQEQCLKELKNQPETDDIKIRKHNIETKIYDLYKEIDLWRLEI